MEWADLVGVLMGQISINSCYIAFTAMIFNLWIYLQDCTQFVWTLDKMIVRPLLHACLTITDSLASSEMCPYFDDNASVTRTCNSSLCTVMYMQ